jgi:hypothetical protein
MSMFYVIACTQSDGAEEYERYEALTDAIEAARRLIGSQASKTTWEGSTPITTDIGVITDAWVTNDGGRTVWGG